MTPMTASLEEQAIKAALNQNWEKAVEINKNILKEKPEDIPALNRLGRAFWELGQNEKAQRTYKKVIKIDRFNPIANKNLKRIGKNKNKNNFKSNFVPSGKVFLEEPGRTKLVRLTRLASPSVLAQLDSGDAVFFLIKKRLVSVLDEQENYLGAIPEDLSQRLIKFIKGGNQYQAFVKSVDHQRLEIFIREVSRGKKFASIPSFPQGKLSLLQ
ncbi:tetratricopeptide repeat protein [Candidatus Shapirobacteria bacterium]|nr:tetratricopeptide repeat protein [Candidatus Shapirobacteria bacterium]